MDYLSFFHFNTSHTLNKVLIFIKIKYGNQMIKVSLNEHMFIVFMTDYFYFFFKGKPMTYLNNFHNNADVVKSTFKKNNTDIVIYCSYLK
jgi:hypothetical protein